jgi:hypothetical protein
MLICLNNTSPKFYVTEQELKEAIYSTIESLKANKFERIWWDIPLTSEYTAFPCCL